MFVRKQMILAILIITVTFGAEAELQIISVQLCPSADRTFVLGDTRLCRLAGLLFEILLPADLLW